MINYRTVELYRDEHRKVLVIEAMEIRQRQFSKGGQLYASMAPVVIIICTPTSSQVLAVETNHPDLDTMKRHHPELDDLIADACRQD